MHIPWFQEKSQARSWNSCRSFVCLFVCKRINNESMTTISEWYRDNSSRIWKLPGCLCLCCPSSFNGEGTRTRCLGFEAHQVDDGVIIRDYFNVSGVSLTKAEAWKSDVVIDILNYEESTRPRSSGLTSKWPVVTFIAALVGMCTMALISFFGAGVVGYPLMAAIAIVWSVYMCTRRGMSGPLVIVADKLQLVTSSMGVNQHIAALVCEYANIEPVTSATTTIVSRRPPLYLGMYSKLMSACAKFTEATRECCAGRSQLAESIDVRDVVSCHLCIGAAMIPFGLAMLPSTHMPEIMNTGIGLTVSGVSLILLSMTRPYMYLWKWTCQC